WSECCIRLADVLPLSAFVSLPVSSVCTSATPRRRGLMGGTESLFARTSPVEVAPALYCPQSSLACCVGPRSTALALFRPRIRERECTAPARGARMLCALAVWRASLHQQPVAWPDSGH